MKPTDFLKLTKQMAVNLAEMQSRAVFVGLPSERVGGAIYGDGRTILSNGAVHEFGWPPIPERSFLRVPFAIKRKELNEAIAKQFEAVTMGRTPVDTGLGLVGVIAANVSKGAFTSQGYGTWPALDPDTVRAKGSSQTLIDTGTLRSSISWVIR